MAHLYDNMLGILGKIKCNVKINFIFFFFFLRFKMGFLENLNHTRGSHCISVGQY